jgi:sulfide dehydrogenase cytochrome subunit
MIPKRGATYFRPQTTNDREGTAVRYRVVLGMILAGLLFPAHAEDKIEALANTCSGCHGANGVSEEPGTPSIGGLPEAYLRKALLDWKAGVRHSPTMGGLVEAYSDEQLGALAMYYAKKPWSPVAQKTDANLVKLGRAVSARCAGCHGETGSANDGETPNLNGQWAPYMEHELREYRDGKESRPNKKMRNIAKRLSEKEIKAVAAFYASQGK